MLISKAQGHGITLKKIADFSFPENEQIREASQGFCCVFGCSSTARKFEMLRFFRFSEVDVSVVRIENAFREPEKID